MKQLYELHAEICETLANPIRIEIINTLRDKELSVGALLSKLKIKKANLSQHLALMRAKGIVKARRDGINIFYRIANPKVIKACDIMRQVLIEQLTNVNKTLKKWGK
ncbi:MAG: metalloregulator ArsR/SmtB family transcription factor [Candidatus Margulisiibacteriota bacterium]